MKARVLSVFVSILLVLSFASTAFAAEIADVKTDFPEISATVKLGKNEKIDSSAVKATLDGQELKVEKAESPDGSAEWIILIDTSMSTKTYFDAEKEAIVSIINSLGEKDSLKLYSFQENITPVLKGSESKEDAVKKVNALKCNGQDTKFYDAVLTQMKDVAASKADKVIPIIISDGKNTINNDSKDKAVKELKASKVPVNGFYADSLDKNTASEFNSFLKASGGSAASFSPENVKSKLGEKAKNNTSVIKLSTDDAVKANENAVLSIDLGDGKPITKKIAVKDWQPEQKATEKEETAASAVADSTETSASESTTAAQKDNKDGFDFTKLLIPAIVVAALLILALVLTSKKKKDNDEKKEKPEKVKKEKSEKVKPEKKNKEPDKPENKPSKPEKENAVIKDDAKPEEPVIKPEKVDNTAAEAEKAAEKAKAAEAEKAAKEAKKEEEKKKADAQKQQKDFQKAAKKKEAEKEKYLKNKKAEAEKKAKEAKKAEEKAKAEAEKEAKKQQKLDEKKKLEAEKKAQQFQFYFEEKEDKKSGKKGETKKK